jgi:hypothetical protein
MNNRTDTKFLQKSNVPEIEKSFFEKSNDRIAHSYTLDIQYMLRPLEIGNSYSRKKKKKKKKKTKKKEKKN